MTKQTLYFNYFAPFVYSSDEDYRKHWNMEKFCEFMLQNRKRIDSSVELGEEVADFEWTEQNYDSKNNLYWFRISKNRTKNIPSIKHLKEEGQPVSLDKEAYVGNYTIYVFDPVKNLIFIQSNFYGLTTRQSELTLSVLRERYKQNQGEKIENTAVKLEPIIDPNALLRIKESEYIRKIAIKGSDVNSLAAEDIKSETLHYATKATQKTSGINFELTLSLGKGNRDKSIDRKEVSEIINDVARLRSRNQDVGLKISAKEDLNHSVELIDFVEPRLKSNLTLDFPNRETPGAEFIYQNFLEQNLLDRDTGDGYTRGFLQKARTYVDW